MHYLIFALALLPVAALVAGYLYVERQAREQDRAETARFRAMTGAERSEALTLAKSDRARAREYRDQMSRLYSSWKWGYRHNPYRIRYATAQGQYAGAQARVHKLETLIAELDTPSA